MAAIDSPAEIYDHIFDALLLSVDADWQEIHLHADVVDSSVHLTGNYRAPFDTTADLDARKLDHSVTKALRTLHRIMTGASEWRKAHFLLKRSGEYAVHFE